MYPAMQMLIPPLEKTPPPPTQPSHLPQPDAEGLYMTQLMQALVQSAAEVEAAPARGSSGGSDGGGSSSAVGGRDVSGTGVLSSKPPLKDRAIR